MNCKLNTAFSLKWAMVQLGLWISTNSSHGFVARSNFVFLTTQFQVCHGNTATFFIELRDETTIISVDGTTGIVVKCWVSSRRNIDRASVEGFQSHHAMLLILLGAARLISFQPHLQRRKTQEETWGKTCIGDIEDNIQVSARAMWFYGNLFVRHIISQYMGKHEFGPFLTIQEYKTGVLTLPRKKWSTNKEF